MPQLQWIGQLPERKSAVAEILGKAGEYGIKGYEAARERRVDLAKISYDKKKDAADMIIKAAENATPQQREQLFGEGSQAGTLIEDVYGAESLETLRGIEGKGKAGKLAKVDTWISTKKKPSPMTGLSVPLTRESADTAIALELSDANWKETYPDRAAAFEASFPKTAKAERRGWFGRREETDYKKMTEQELYDKAMAGDTRATQEAISRGYPVGR